MDKQSITRSLRTAINIYKEDISRIHKDLQNLEKEAKEEISRREDFISLINTLTQEDLQNLDKEVAINLLKDYCNCTLCDECLGVNEDYCIATVSEEFLENNYDKFIKQIFKI